MLELATLGLLQREPLHGYRLKQQLELFMSSCISVNYGAIYPLLKRLEQRELIQVCMEEEGIAGSSRKIYRITEKGKKRWQKKMLEHPQESWVNSRSRFMIKFFFFKNIQSEERFQLIEHRLMECRLRLHNQDIEPLTDFYQETAWQRYQVVLLSEINWLEEQLILEQKNLKEVISR